VPKYLIYNQNNISFFLSLVKNTLLNVSPAVVPEVVPLIGATVNRSGLWFIGMIYIYSL